MVTLFKRSNGILYLEFIQYGKKVQRSTKLEDTPTNRAFIKREIIPPLKQKILMGDFDKEKPKEFSYYSSIYIDEKKHLKTIKKITKHIDNINNFFGDKQIDKISRGDIKEYLSNMMKSNTPKTARNYLSNIRGVFHVAYDAEVIKTNPTLDIQLPTHQVQVVEPFTPNEVKILLLNANDFFKLYLSIAFYTGMRSGEILGLQKSDFDFDKGIINIQRSITGGKITTPKTDKSIRTVPILAQLMPYLKFTNKIKWLFHKRNGDNMFSFGGNLKKQWISLLKFSEIDYRKIYATRHTFIVSMLKYSKLSVIEIAQIVGHTNTQMIIRHYAKYIKDEHLKIDRDIKLY
ncbi:MAG: tyrosine-type recombinase/integrase [Campylobacterota bacterium]|nr:tyrosine-type recombinase/integrase [Campylobacterota bacterium]